MHLVYIDETGNDKCIGYSALAVPSLNFSDIFKRIKDFRRSLRASDEIYTTFEMHASKFTSGRGKVSKRFISQARRCEIFIETLKMINALPGVRLFNAFREPKEERMQLLERLMTRLDRSMVEWASQAILFFDEGEEKSITTLSRRLAVYNPIRSRYGVWANGNEYKNFPISNIIEDPVFRQSHRSYLIQLVDFCAYALLQKEKPTESRKQFGLEPAWTSLADIIVFEANQKDEFGVIR